jgi:hypothetical protein
VAEKRIGPRRSPTRLTFFVSFVPKAGCGTLAKIVGYPKKARLLKIISLLIMSLEKTKSGWQIWYG